MVLALIIVVPHSKLISSLKPPHLLRLTRRLMSIIFYPVDYAIPNAMGF